jgi:hypothetical protein
LHGWRPQSTLGPLCDVTPNHRPHQRDTGRGRRGDVRGVPLARARALSHRGPRTEPQRSGKRRR